MSAMPILTTSREDRGQPGNRALACTYCRSKKIRCNREHPCANCFDHENECVYPAPRRRVGVRRARKSLITLEERLLRMETLLEKANEEGGEKDINSSPRHEQLSQSPETPHRAEIGVPDSSEDGSSTRHEAPTTEATLYTPAAPAAPMTAVGWPSDSVVESERMGTQLAREAAEATEATGCVSTEEIPSWEYHGPTTFLSICSIPAIDWVSERTGESGFGESARALAMKITRRLKMPQNMNRRRAQEPDPSTAWRYCEAYFEHSFDTVFGVVVRPIFEARLRLHLAQKTPADDDPAWYALRNTVYASGCRIELSKIPHPTTFEEAQACAWQFFENALSVHTELLYCTTGLMAVQALAAMSFFAEGIGSPSLDYMLCSCAMRLAQSKGLHRQAPKAWNLSETELQHRNWLFWAIYFFEKHISYRSGRSSAIDDDDISCSIPTSVPLGSSIHIECFTYMVKHAQISSHIAKRLATGKAFRQTPKQIREIVHELDLELQQWRNSLPPYLQLDAPITLNQLPPNVHMQHILYLRYAYSGSVMAIHSIFTCPWNSALFKTDQSLVLRNQISLSTNTVVNAARNIILATNYIYIDASTPTWLALYFPLVSLINLFIYILKYPTLPAARSDIALIDVAVGHFARLEFASPELSFPFTREAARLARAMAATTRDGSTSSNMLSSTPTDVIEERIPAIDIDAWNNFENEDMIDFYTDDWSTLLPSLTETPAAALNSQFSNETPGFFS